MDATYTIPDRKRSELARMLDVKPKDMHNWYTWGSKLLHGLATDMYELTGVSPDRSAPLEIHSNNTYFSQNPYVIIFELKISAIEIPSYFKAPAKKHDPERPVILDVRNRLIFGQETLELAKQAGHKTLRVIRLDARALLICTRNILKHPNRWLGYELRTIALYLEAFAKKHRITHAESSQSLISFIAQRLNVKDKIISNARAFSFFKPKSRPSETKSNDNSENNSRKLKF